MTDRKHNVLVDIDGQQVGFRFSTWAFDQTIKRANLKGLIEMYQKLGDLAPDVVMILTMEARKEFLLSDGKADATVSLREASDLIDSMGGIIAAVQEFSEGIQSHAAKNVTAPTT